MKNKIISTRRLALMALLAAQGLSPLVRAEDQVAPIPGVLGKITAVSNDSVDVGTPAGVVHVGIRQPLTTYKQVPTDLAHITPTSYVGIPSVGQADGTQVAKLVLIFPPELKGAAEGSVITDPAPNQTTHSRMTNGSVSSPAEPHSRMTNGTVQAGSGTSFTVTYEGGSQTILVPADVPVMNVAPVPVNLGVGDVVYLPTDKQPDGSLSTNKIFQFIAAAK
jgi:hypothetical protein